MIDRRLGVPTSLGSRIPMTSLIQTLAVAEYLNFRHAANALVVSLSSVSARVKTLEEYLGILLVRHGNGGIRHQWLIANRWEARHVKH
jgi:predicted transcriptional regulator